jgi:Icc-related predicted phosphoesterase
MKIAICSDLHLEFSTISLENKENADVLILSGDICVAKDLCGDEKSDKIITFFDECSVRFPHVIYVMGNHEHYHGNFSDSLGIIRDKLGYLDNLHVLEKQNIVIDGVGFVAGTLWTDMNKEDPITLNFIRGYMHDFRIINDGDSLFTPEKTVAEFKAMVGCIDESIKTVNDIPWVVVGHHAPSKMSVKPRYQGEHIVNGAYSSDLSEFILDRPQIKLWTHGHTHDEFDYVIGSTRIVCNPRGYDGWEEQADSFKLKYVEI